MRFDPVRKVLEIVFRGARGAYRYFGVPVDEWQRFRNAPSKGIYLNQFFKLRRYTYEKISSGDQENGGAAKFYPMSYPASFCWPEPN